MQHAGFSGGAAWRTEVLGTPAKFGGCGAARTQQVGPDARPKLALIAPSKHGS